MVKFHNKSYVDLIDCMGSDISVVNAARVSFDKESDYVYDHELDDYTLSHSDQKLIKYLAEHDHFTPFCHAFLTLRIKSPIYVARQLVKHQVGLSWNEVSRRYVDSEPEFFIPDVFHKRPDASIKQGSSEEAYEYSDAARDNLKKRCEEAAADYNWYIAHGMAPEEARMFLPHNLMTEWIWSGSLMAFCRVCNLRLSPHAQRDTKEVAKQIYTILSAEDPFPYSTKALVKYD